MPIKIHIQNILFIFIDFSNVPKEMWITESKGRLQDIKQAVPFNIITFFLFSYQFLHNNLLKPSFFHSSGFIVKTDSKSIDLGLGLPGNSTKAVGGFTKCTFTSKVSPYLSFPAPTYTVVILSYWLFVFL